ncbi:class I SAM-dependent methyltransferase [Phytoactinopolyspora limicola]|uniref:class I SAM-dependent methyltransferase n=1 Tax=Phytoactinopolyspora limicola TaxID=2715536 RepID=UPI00140AA1BD|nr:class I SAM-dependent methyltransferase [Phytoactinopolyspora limicola]
MNPSESFRCRICRGPVWQFLDLGRQPISDAFRTAGDTDPEFFFDLAVGRCAACTMIQLTNAVPRERMFHAGYPYLSSGSAVMREHFARTAASFLETELRDDGSFVIEIGCNDGVMLGMIAEAGRRHLGVEPSAGVARIAEDAEVRVRVAFFEESTARDIVATEGRADLAYSANTICHIPYLDSVFRGLDAVLKPSGIFVFEDPYFGDIVAKTSYDQIYDEHFYYFTVRSVREMVRRFGFELVDVAPLAVHGGELRYTVARAGQRTVTPAVAEWLAAEERAGLAEAITCSRFAANVGANRRALRGLLERLHEAGHSVAGYGATAKSATVTNFVGITPELVSYVCDSTPAKQGRLTPGAHLPVLSPERFREPYPDYALLFAWNHAEEIMAKEHEFRDHGGRWITYVPDVAIR